MHGTRSVLSLTVVIQYDFVEHSSRGFPALVLVDHVSAQLLQGQGVRYGFAGKEKKGRRKSGKGSINERTYIKCFFF